MKTLFLSLSLLALLLLSAFGSGFGTTTNQPAIGTNTISSITASNLYVYNALHITNSDTVFNSPTNLFVGTNTFAGSNTFIGPLSFSNTPLALNIIGAMNISITFTNTFLTNGVLAGRTNTLYFTNGILVQLTTP